MIEFDQNGFFEQVLFQVLGNEHEILHIHFKSGGCISTAVHLMTNRGQYFIKWNEGEQYEGMFEAEALGLELLRKADALTVPEVLGYGEVAGRHYLLLEYIDVENEAPDFWLRLGEDLAVLHGHTQKQFGLHFNNYIGRLPQNNAPAGRWVDFFIERRLNMQLGLALYNGRIDQAFAERFKRIYPKLYNLLPEEAPALLHGDLWSGNVMVGPNGQAAIFDPATYYGHREAEIAFTQLFGGFEPQFYEAYTATFPMEPGFEERVPIYNLYPLLVHVNLFGGSYLSGVERTVNRLLD